MNININSNCNIIVTSSNTKIIPEGIYNENTIKNYIYFNKVYSDYTYLIFNENFLQGTTLSNCYYFHNIIINQQSCLDVIYEDLRSSDKHITLTNSYGEFTATSNTSGLYKLTQNRSHISILAHWTGTTLNINYPSTGIYTLSSWNSFTTDNKLQIFNKQYYVTTNGSYMMVRRNTNNMTYFYYDFTVAGAIPKLPFFPNFIFRHGFPVTNLNLFDNIVELDITPKIYTYSEFIEELANAINKVNDDYSAIVTNNTLFVDYTKPENQFTLNLNGVFNNYNCKTPRCPTSDRICCLLKNNAFLYQKIPLEPSVLGGGGNLRENNTYIDENNQIISVDFSSYKIRQTIQSTTFYYLLQTGTTLKPFNNQYTRIIGFSTNSGPVTLTFSNGKTITTNDLYFDLILPPDSSIIASVSFYYDMYIYNF